MSSWEAWVGIRGMASSKTVMVPFIYFTFPPKQYVAATLCQALCWVLGILGRVRAGTWPPWPHAASSETEGDRHMSKWFCHQLAKWPWACHLTSLSFTSFICQMRRKSMYLMGLSWGQKVIFIKQPSPVTRWQEALSKGGSIWYIVKGWYKLCNRITDCYSLCLTLYCLTMFWVISQKGSLNSYTELLAWGGRK